MVALLLAASAAAAQQPDAAPSAPPPAPALPVPCSAEEHCPPPACPCDCPSPWLLVTFGDFIYWNVRGVDLVYAQPMNTCAPTAVPVGPLAVLRPDYSPGFRIGGGVTFGRDAALRGTFTWLRNTTTNAVAAPDGALLRTSLEHPNALTCPFDSLSAAGTSDFDLRLVDLDYSHVLAEGTSWRCGGLVGLRYGHLDQEALATYSNLETTTVRSAVRFDGVGPRAGLGGRYHLGYGLQLYGNSVISLLAGSFRSDFRQVNTFVGRQAFVNFNDDRIVPVLEMEMGVGWSNSGGRLHVQAGYYLAGWFNAVTNPTFINAVQTGNFSRNGDALRDRLTLDGLTARMELRF
jgi:hypothetical protein